LCDWLTRKQRESRRGRAELRLAERAAAWNTKPDARFLPSWWEWPNILLFTKRGKWTTRERRVMRAAARFHGLRLTGLLAVVAIAVFTGLVVYRRAEVRHAETLAEAVFAAPPDAVRYTLDNLQPTGRLALPRLREKLVQWDSSNVQSLHAAYALADILKAPQAFQLQARGTLQSGKWVWSVPTLQDFLLDAIATAPAGECQNLLDALAHVKASALPEIVRRAQDATDASEKARHAIVALHLGDHEPAKNALEVSDDPVYRTTLIHAYSNWHGDLIIGTQMLGRSRDAEFRSGLCAAFGTIVPTSLKYDERDMAASLLSTLYIKAPDGATHSAAGWALRQWKRTLPVIEPSSRAPSYRGWFVNGQGMTMVEVAGGKFTMGTVGEKNGVEDDNEKPAHEVTLTKAFYIDDREVTVEQFQRFIDDTQYDAAEKPEGWQQDFQQSKQYSPTPDCPVQNVSWFDAVLYCNWLSTREGRKPCYERTGDNEKLNVFHTPQVPDTEEQEYDVWRCDFTAEGYRLPTGAEWEFAARAGSTADFCYGNDEDLLSQLAWFVVNAKRTWPGGLKLPNAFGLFDMHGNVWEWCWDRHDSFAAEAVRDPTGPNAWSGREVRGGAFFGPNASVCRSACRSEGSPNSRFFSFGFRVLCGR
jgi:formylglycine-generating enzyme required for sulfatase activity